jgi:hypothetical protein
MHYVALLVRQIISFPNPVDDHAARLVALGVVLMAVGTIVLDQPWMLLVIAYGFLARVLTGPTLSPLGRLVTRVVIPALGRPPKHVPGPPKRFAQGIGLVFSTTAVVLHFGFGATGAAYVVLGLLATAASLEAFLGFCCGCMIFAGLMHTGVISDDTCDACNDIWSRATA